MAKLIALLLVACAFAAVSADKDMKLLSWIQQCGNRHFNKPIPAGHPMFNKGDFLSIRDRLLNDAERRPCAQSAQNFMDRYNAIGAENQLPLPVAFRNCIREALLVHNYCTEEVLSGIFPSSA